MGHVMSSLLDEIMASPRARIIHAQLLYHLEQEQAARAEFRRSLHEDLHAEFLNGEVVKKPATTFFHNSICENIFLLLNAHVSAHRSGVVGSFSYLVELSRNDVEPDVSFWKREKSSKFTEDQFLLPSPDLAVEVLSESTEQIDRGTKFEDYATRGVTEYWIVDPDNRVLEQYILKGDAYELRQKSGNGTVRCVAIEGCEFPIEAFFDDEANQQALSAIR
jgi:Uma2 family endonuclease